MDCGHFYFIKDQYFVDFPDKFLMGGTNRPLFYAFKELRTGIFWMIPFTSQVEKFRRIYQHKIQRYGKCDTIEFGEVLGYEKAFLIQNMCPVTPKYIEKEYIEKRTGDPVRIDGVLESRILAKANRVLALQRNGKNIIYPDVLKIEKALLAQS